jgi:hypothetical protein
MAQALMDELAKRGLSNPPNINDAVVSFGQVADIYDGWLRAVSVEHRPLIALLLAGYRRLDGSAPTPMVYLLVSNVRFAPQLAGAYPMMIGVPQYAVYLSHRYYDPNISLGCDCLEMPVRLEQDSWPHDTKGEFHKRHQIMCKQRLQNDVGTWIRAYRVRSYCHCSLASSGISSSSSSGGANTGDGAAETFRSVCRATKASRMA